MPGADDILNFNHPKVEPYKRNFLQQSVCELRFPTLLELGESKPPAKLVNALRKEYPHLELANEVTLGIGSANSGSNNTHIFRSPKLNWAISVKQSSVSIETTSYQGFDNMKERISFILHAISDVIDTDFFTRIGLRYINVIEIGEDDIQEWVNTDLVSPIAAKKFNLIHEYSGRFQMGSEDGGCLVQHGIRIKRTNKAGDPLPDYVLDIDGFRNVVELKNTLETLDKIHEQTSSIFHWALGPKAVAYLEG